MKSARCKMPSGDRDVDCESEMLARFYALVEQALGTGWAEEEVANALLSLAQHYSLDVCDRSVIEIPLDRPLH